METDEPKRPSPNILRELPRRVKDRTLNPEPMSTNARTERVLPRRAIPYMLSAEPMRAKLRTDIELPKLQKSRTEKEEPRYVTP
jgi:hypothetical protein